MEALSTLLYFLVTIGILVSFHEFGHYAAARLWVDAVIDPADTRLWLSMGLEMSNNAPLERAYNPGVLQV
mgnify:CR=1 FL=1